MNRKEKDALCLKIARLDWIKILSEAIEMRPSSFYPRGFVPVEGEFNGKKWKTEKYSPSEWRNASDEIRGAVIRAMKRKRIL